MMMMMGCVVYFAFLAMGGLRAMFMIPLSFTASVYFLTRASGVYSTCNSMHLALSLWYLDRLYHVLVQQR